MHFPLFSGSFPCLLWVRIWLLLYVAHFHFWFSMFELNTKRNQWYKPKVKKSRIFNRLRLTVHSPFQQIKLFESRFLFEFHITIRLKDARTILVHAIFDYNIFAIISKINLDPFSDKPGRRNRTTYKRWQIEELERAFCLSPYPTSVFKKALAIRLGLRDSRVQVEYALSSSYTLNNHGTVVLFPSMPYPF